MSHQHWELLAKITTGQLTDAAVVCQGLARETEAERLFFVVSRPSGEQVLGIDCDGYALSFAAERLADGGLSDLVFRFVDAPAQRSQPVVVRRVSRASKRAVIAATLGLEGELGVSLILENRFAGEGLASFDDARVVRWLLLLALVVRLNAALERPLEPENEAHERPKAPRPTTLTSVAFGPALDTTSPATQTAATGGHSERTEIEARAGVEATWEGLATSPEQDERQRADTLGALRQEHWNISRAARRLGMTRHGLKKRMRRLSLLKAS